MRPTSQQVLTVINNFKKVMRRPSLFGHKLNMQKENVHICGTAHCHGGWYYISKHGGDVVTNTHNFSNGANEMAIDLGFGWGSSELSAWASRNPEIWGNSDGIFMFGIKSAFSGINRPSGAQNLQHIVDHWTEVYGRIKALEEKEVKQEIQEGRYKDITKEIAGKAIQQDTVDVPVKVLT